MNEITLQKKQNYAIIYLQRPKKMNALNHDLLNNLSDIIYEISKDEKIRCLVITGEGKSFSTGADINERVKQSVSNQTYLKVDPLAEKLREVQMQIETINIPVIAAVNGYAVGGGLELALACDIRYASENAQFGLTEAKVGSIPGTGGTQRLSRLIGLSRAKEMIFSGRLIKAKEAFDIGLISEVMPEHKFLDYVEERVQIICKKAPISLAYIKKAIQLGTETSLPEGLEIEKILHHGIQKTDDYSEGMKAFIEKREPNFTNK